MKKDLKYALMMLLVFTLTSMSTLAADNQVQLVAGSENPAKGELVLSETQAGMFQEGELIFAIENNQAGICLEDVEVNITGGLKGVKTKVSGGTNGKVTVTLSRSSKAPATIILSDFKFTVDRTVPEGSYDLELSGDAISKGDDKVIIKDFIQIITPNTQDLAKGEVAKGSSAFVIGQESYTQNDSAFEMDGAAYVMEPGYIMVPIRYVAAAFGVEEKNILFSEKTITLFAGGRTISLTKDSKEALVNGVKISLEVPVTIKDGRTYAPAGQIASLLGISAKWDNETKTASFINE